MRFIGIEGVTEDLTAFVVGRLGERPRAESMTELALLVAGVFASEEPPSEVVEVAPATIGDVAEVVYDVLGLGDDAVRGLRLRLFAEPFDGGFALRTVEGMTICGRGVTSEGLCA